MIHSAALFPCRMNEYAVTGILAGRGGGINFDVPVPNPKRKFNFGGIGVASRFPGGLIFYIRAVAHLCGRGGVTRNALHLGVAEPYVRQLRSSLAPGSTWNGDKKTTPLYIFRHYTTCYHIATHSLATHFPTFDRASLHFCTNYLALHRASPHFVEYYYPKPHCTARFLHIPLHVTSLCYLLVDFTTVQYTTPKWCK